VAGIGAAKLKRRRRTVGHCISSIELMSGEFVGKAGSWIEVEKLE
jgi:hypothetical protein